MKVHYFVLPSKEDDELVWKQIKSAKVIVAVGPGADEHDLLVKKGWLRTNRCEWYLGRRTRRQLENEEQVQATDVGY